MYLRKCKNKIEGEQCGKLYRSPTRIGLVCPRCRQINHYVGRLLITKKREGMRKWLHEFRREIEKDVKDTIMLNIKNGVIELE